MDENKLSFVGKWMNWAIKGNYRNTRLFAYLFLVIDAAWIYLAVTKQTSIFILNALLWFVMAMMWFMKSGFQEILQKRYNETNNRPTDK